MANMMFLVTFMMGYLPSRMSNSKEFLKMITLYGAGLLVGAALIIIVPEGMTILSDAVHEIAMKESSTSDQKINQDQYQKIKSEANERINRYVGASLIFGFSVMLVIDQGLQNFLNQQQEKNHKNEQALQEYSSGSLKKEKTQIFYNSKFLLRKRQQREFIYESFDDRTLDSLNRSPESHGLNHDKEKYVDYQSAKNQDSNSYNNIINESIIEIPEEETISEKHKCHIKVKKPKVQRRYSIDNAADIDSSTASHYDLKFQRELLRLDSHHMLEHEPLLSDNTRQQKKKETQENKVIVTTIGLVIHCLSDGIALGTSVFLSTKFQTQQGLGLLIFMAILLHKAPGAIGFGAFLYHAGLRNWSIIKHLLAFTLACPVSAIASFHILKNMHMGSDQTDMMFWVGILLIISAGSFIYVATIHILPEVIGNSTHSHGHDHGHGIEENRDENFEKTGKNQQMSKGTELLCILFGLVSPLVLTFLNDE